MKRALFMLLTVLLLALPVTSWSADVPLIWDPMDGYQLGKTFSDNIGVNTSPPTWGALFPAADNRTATIVPDPLDPSNKVMDIYDKNNDTKDNWIFHYYKQVTYYTCTIAYDVMFPQNTAGFKSMVGLVHSSTAPNTNNGNTWIAGIAFEGNQCWWASGVGTPGRIYYQTKSFTQVWQPTTASCTPNTWYTVVINCDLINKKYSVSFGPKGGTLSEITPPGGVDFIIRQNNPTYPQVTQLNYVAFASTTKTGGTPAETEGHMYVDNVNVHGFSENDGEWIQSMDDIFKLPVGRYLELDHIQGRCAMVGTDQLGKPFFYLAGKRADGTMDPRGIRVRQDPQLTTVHQGDYVQVLGYIQRASDNGAQTSNVGEKEILAIIVEAQPQNSPLPAPRAMNNRDIGGGDQFLVDGNTGKNLEPDGKAAYPGVFGGWIDATAGTSKVAPGPNNVGTYGRFYGKVTYVSQDPSQPYWPYIYIDDGSGVFDGSLPDGTNPQKGVRVLLRKDRTYMVDINQLLGKHVIVPGVIGAVSTSDLLPNQPAYNCRVIRAIEEAFYDDDGNGYYSGQFSNDWNFDYNGNGIYDGILVLD